ncbi:class I SAM-dependent methyltransferase [Bacillus litorisediminis]|uniref:class I SAM-dependent methyltransferase n=1 Tax=Bacillus litorisediminis TaxID=2922713 RepID=UPI001FAC36D1|nr:class I SAM-dependent methyltransferase [Bacillus litorisediminis]
MNHYDRQLEESWKVNSKAWTESIRYEKIISRKTVTNPAIIQTILSQMPQSVLDVGCGEGWLARELAQKGIHVVGIDSSEPLIDEAKKLGGGEFHCMNYDAFSDHPTVVGAEFDVAVFNFSLLSEQIQPVLYASKQVIKNSGRIIIQTLHPISVIKMRKIGMRMAGELRSLMVWVKDIKQVCHGITELLRRGFKNLVWLDSNCRIALNRLILMKGNLFRLF